MDKASWGPLCIILETSYESTYFKRKGFLKKSIVENKLCLSIYKNMHCPHTAQLPQLSYSTVLLSLNYFYNFKSLGN